MEISPLIYRGGPAPAPGTFPSDTGGLYIGGYIGGTLTGTQTQHSPDTYRLDQARYGGVDLLFPFL